MSNSVFPTILPRNKTIVQSEEETSPPIKTRFKLDESFFSALLKRLEEHRYKRSQTFRKMKRRRVGWFATDEQNRLSFTNLSQKILSELIETAFWASLEQEEGRSIKFSITYRCLVESESTAVDDLLNQDLVFDSPKEFNVKNLVKLAPAIEENSSILISTSGNESLEIKGISLLSFSPLKITVLDPGKLIISYEMENIAVISGNEVVFIRHSSLYVNTSEIWSKLFPHDEGLSSFSDSRTSVIINTLRQMRKLKHGGTLIIVPSNKKYKKFVNMPIPYCGENLFTFGSETINSAEKKAKKDRYYSWLDLEDLAQKFAQFTAVDGATLLTRKLDLIGFGIKLKGLSKGRKNTKIYKTDPLDHSEWFKSVEITELGNTRHQSAANFVFNFTDSIAFVVSQDGNVTAFGWNVSKETGIGSLFATSRLELLLF